MLHGKTNFTFSDKNDLNVECALGKSGARRRSLVDLKIFKWHITEFVPTPPVPGLVNGLYQKGLLSRLFRSHIKLYQPSWLNVTCFRAFCWKRYLIIVLHTLVDEAAKIKILEPGVVTTYK